MKQDAPAKRPRKSRSRAARGGSERFGIRYLHHHMFTADTPSGQQLCPHECKCGSSMASVYSNKTLAVMAVSILVLLIGVTFMLVGYLIPRRPVVYLEKADGIRTPLDHSAIKFNTMLDNFTLIGTVSVSVGALVFCLVLIVPICRSSRNLRGEYSKAPTDETHSSPATPADTAPTAARGKSTVQKIPVLAVVHSADSTKPEKKRPTPAGRRDKAPHRSKLGKARDSIEEEG